MTTVTNAGLRRSAPVERDRAGTSRLGLAHGLMPVIVLVTCSLALTLVVIPAPYIGYAAVKAGEYRRLLVPVAAVGLMTYGAFMVLLRSSRRQETSLTAVTRGRRA